MRSLVAQLRAHGYETDRVSLPFKCHAKEEILAHAAAWQLVDFSEANGRRIDRGIATKFPAYFGRHPHKVTWFMHQYRQAYIASAITATRAISRARRPTASQGTSRHAW